MERKIRAVIDTNLFVSGIFGKKPQTLTLQQLWINEEIQLATSLEIMKEVSRVLSYPKIRQRLGTDDKEIRDFFRLIFRKAVIAQDLYKIDKIADDPADNKFLACALETKADYIISGDNHLLSLEHYHGIQIVDAGTFIKIVKGK